MSVKNVAGGKGKDFAAKIAAIGSPMEDNGIVARVVTITPKMAQDWLDANADSTNRNPSQMHVSRLSATMQRGGWTLIHQGIGFNMSGRLIDGQHRLMAIVNTGMAAQVAVYVYTDSEHANNAMMVIDNSIRARGNGDVLAIMGVAEKERAKDISAVVHVMSQIERGFGPMLDAISAAKIYQTNKAAIDWSMRALPKDTAPVRGAFAYAYPIDSDKVDNLARLIVERSNVAPGTAAHAYLLSAESFRLRLGRSGGGARSELAQRVMRVIMAHVLDERGMKQVKASNVGIDWARERRAEMEIPLGL